MNQLDNERTVLIFGDYFWEFYYMQSQKVKDKINWTIKLVKTMDRIPEKHFKHIKGTTLYEIRTSFGSNIYRIFCFFDQGNLIVVLNGFQKKSQKTPKNEINLALSLQKQYYNENKDQDNRL